MAEIAFIDNNLVLAQYFLKRDYTELSKQVLEAKENMTEYIEEAEILAGYTISKNEPLSVLFHSDFYVVRFSFANFKTVHVVKQEEMITELFHHLDERMNEVRGYYNMRVPTHIVDVLKSYNAVFHKAFFCGGTVEEIISGKEVKCTPKDGVKVFFADMDYIEKHRKELMDMTFESFKSYHGQYHISPVTQEGAGEIYENWIRYSLENCNEKNIVVADYEGKPIGFVTIEESEHAVEGVLNAVDEKYRNLGAYRSMIALIINKANENHKSFVISTQFDNFIVQGVWNAVGLKPFYSIYNFHIDRR